MEFIVIQTYMFEQNTSSSGHQYRTTKQLCHDAAVLDAVHSLHPACLE